MATLADLQAKILRLLADETAASYSEALVQDGIREALLEILPWTPRLAVETYTGNGVAVSFALPADFYRPIGVQLVENALWIPEAQIAPFQARGSDIRVNNDWAIYPEGFLNLAVAPEVDEEILLHYGAQWEEPADSTDEITSPRWTHLGLIFYAASYATLKMALSTADVRQWNIQIDSGTPIHNPLQIMSRELYARFVDHMNGHPARAKSRT